MLSRIITFVQRSSVAVFIWNAGVIFWGWRIFGIFDCSKQSFLLPVVLSDELQPLLYGRRNPFQEGVLDHKLVLVGDVMDKLRGVRVAADYLNTHTLLGQDQANAGCDFE